MAHILVPEIADSYDALRRAFLETWYLQLEFRMTDSATKVARWFHTGNQSWSADMRKVNAFVEGLRNIPANFGREYGELSALAHPTAEATVQSCAVVLARYGNPVTEVGHSVELFKEDFVGLLIREIWLVDAEHENLIDLQICRENLTVCNEVFDAFIAEGQQQ